MSSSSSSQKVKIESNQTFFNINESNQTFFNINAKDECCFTTESDVMRLRTGFNLHELIDIPTSTPKSTVGSVLCKKCNVLGVEDGISMLRCEAANCGAVYHKKCIESAVREVMAKHKSLKRFDISCPHCALVDQDMQTSIGKNFQFLYKQTPPGSLDCAKVKIQLRPNLTPKEVETVQQILTGTLPSFWTMEQQCKYLKERISRR